MGDQDYSLREETTFRTELFRRMDNQDSELSEIKKDGKLTKEQAYKTNGRVSKLEFWRSTIIWAFGVLLALLFPILQFIKHELNAQIVGILSTYNINAHD